MSRYKRFYIALLCLLINSLHATDPPLPVIAAGQNSDGRLEIFYIRSNAMYHRWQTAPSGGWSYEYTFYEPAMGVAVEMDSEGCLHVFVIQPDDSLIHIAQSAPSNGWDDPEAIGETAKSIAPIHDQGDSLHLFFTSSDNILCHQIQILPGKEWSERSVLSGQATAVAAGLNLDGRLEVFYSGSGDTLFHKWQNAPGGTWSDQNVFAGPVKQIEVAQNLDGRMEVFYIDQADVLHHRWQVAPSSGWDDPSLFATQAYAVFAGRNEDGRLIILYPDENDILHHRMQIAANSAWHPAEQSGWTAQGVAVAKNSDGRLEVLYLDMDDILFHNWQLEPGRFWAGEYPFPDSDEPLFETEAFPEDPVYTPGPGNWHVNDHCFIQGPDGRWHMVGIVWPDPGSGDPTIANYFGHATADSLEQSVWIEQDPPFYESLDGGKVLWAPHIIFHDNTYYMFYCNGGDVERYAIVVRTSEDLVTWSDPALCFTDGYQGRDPMIIWCEDESEWILYYTATEYPSGGNFLSLIHI